MKQFLTLLLFSLLTFSCNNSKKETYSAFDKKIEANRHPGKKLMEINCNICHSATASEENRLAPPMIAVKMRYINEGTTKKAFINDLKAWIENPNIEDAKMYGAVKRFGIMPKQIIPEESLEKIGEYIFDYNIAQPDWFEEHYKKTNKMSKNHE